MVTTMAAVADIIPPRDRGRYQGFFGGVFGLSTVLGPLIGGFFVEHLNWRWIFYINLPLGLVALGVIAVAFTAPIERRRPKIDGGGAALIAILLTALVLFTSLGGHSFAWGSPTILGLMATAIVSLAALLVVESRVAEPILPLRLFANPTFVIACAVGFIVGLAMFGSVTYMPVYLQVVKGVSPSTAGLQLTPMMGGVLVTSILSGQLISRFGRYRFFPIAGTAIMTLGLGLLSTLGQSSSTWAASGYMLILGAGLGMVMQVLVLAVQNTADYRDLGVATSGTTLFRSTGGSVGVSLFGAIFAANLASGLTARMPVGASLPSATNAAAISALPSNLRHIYLDVFTAALHPVFQSATVIAAFAFVLTWFLRETPLQGAARSESIGESFAMPHDATSLEELETIVSHYGARENRWEAYRRIATRVGVALAPDEMWLLGQVCRATTAVVADDLAMHSSAMPGRIDDVIRRLIEQKLLKRQADGALSVSEDGREIYDRIVNGYRDSVAALLQRWSPDEHAEVRAMLNRLASDFVTELPLEPGAQVP